MSEDRGIIKAPPKRIAGSPYEPFKPKPWQKKPLPSPVDDKGKLKPDTPNKPSNRFTV
tara:strand:+ start:535 stop:708 length:174 start_codon:yes stop_codon:yes gene_type:complete